MFEKLKEYGLYIIIWLIALWALAYAFLSTRNSQAWADVLSKVQDNLINAISKSQKVKDTTTFVTHAQWLEWLSIGQYKLDLSKAYVLNENWDDTVIGWTLSNDLADASADGKLNIVMVTSKQKWADATKAELTTNTAKTTKGATVLKEYNKDWSAWKEKLSTLNEQERWFLATWYVWFATFWTESDAKSFRDSYFPNWMVSKKDATHVWVFVEISR